MSCPDIVCVCARACALCAFVCASVCVCVRVRVHVRVLHVFIYAPHAFQTIQGMSQISESMNMRMMAKYNLKSYKFMWWR
jgi:hypothetical protein